MNVKEALKDTFELLMEDFPVRKGKYPRAIWSNTVEQKIYVGEKDDKGWIGWKPLEKDVYHDFIDIESELGTKIHSDIVAYFNSDRQQEISS